ncbi:MAG: HAMP domain-containing sensor histidine kinase [Rhodocyclaceae bacterium]|nr:HAMP domain-containing sensor histidine kinase [Rhodocyclaceae bacterium]MDZ4213524.1 HAMP domain-containing sensor histidine kinase [Rhodocyclaceae bacterium]
MNSIRVRLIVWLTLALAASSILVGLIAYQLAWDGFNRLRDYSLEQIAYTILQHEVNPSPYADKGGQYLSQVWNRDGSLRFSTRPEIKLPLQPAGPHLLEWLGEEWHVHTVMEGERIVQVANTTSNRSVMFEEIRIWLWIPLALLVLLLGALMSGAVGEALVPLDALRKQILAQAPTQLKPLPVEEHPVEIAPLVDSINDLLTRLDHLLSKQRSFIADAAHEMRTPLTAIKLQAQVMAASTTAADRQVALTALRAGVDRATHLVEQLLQLARFDAEAMHAPILQPCQLASLARQLVIEFSQLAEDRRIDLGLGHCDELSIAADAAGLRILLGNLIDNALRYAGEGGRVDVEVRAAADQVALWVIDTGPGIPPAAREQVFERFRRLASADIPGSGLGLAIVKEIVELHHGQISLLDTPGGGLSVRVALPLA